MFRIGICDDEITTCAELEKMILDIGTESGIKLSVDVWYTGNAFIEDIDKINGTDLLLLDIELPDRDGIDVGQMIRKMNNYRMLIAYISSKKSYAMELFQNQPIAFLIKPIQREELKTVIENAYKRVENNKSIFEYKKGQEINIVNCENIVYFESSLKKIEVVLDSGGRDVFYGKLTDIYPQLPRNFSFIHQSYIINRNYVKKYSYDEIEMLNNKVLPISKVHRTEIRSAIQADMMGSKGHY